MSHVPSECPTLSEALHHAGVSKKKLAELLGIDRKTVSRMGESISDKVAQVLAEHNKTGEIVTNNIPAPTETPINIPARKEPSDYTDDDILALLKRRGSGEADYDIAHSIGLKVHEFDKVIHDHAVKGCIARIGRCHAA